MSTPVARLRAAENQAVADDFELRAERAPSSALARALRKRAAVHRGLGDAFLREAGLRSPAGAADTHQIHDVLGRRGAEQGGRR